jgi:hypothetical protein
MSKEKSYLYQSAYRISGANAKGNNLEIGFSRSRAIFPYEGGKLYHFGMNNDYPNVLKKVLSYSAASLSCIETLANFTVANGFLDKKAGNFKVNERQTADQLLSKLAIDVATWEASALLIWIDGNNDTIKAEAISYELIRAGLEGQYYYNETYNLNTPRISETYEIRAYCRLSDEERLQKVVSDIELYGEVQPELFYMQLPNTLFDGIYNYPNWASDLDAIISDFQNSKFRLSLINDGFMPSVIITLIDDGLGKGQNFDGSANGAPSRSYVDEVSEKINEVKGADSGAKAFVMAAPDKDSLPQIMPFDQKAIIDGQIPLSDALDRRVCRAFGIDPAIKGLSTEGQLGNNQQMLALIDILNNGKIRGYKLAIENLFRELYPKISFSWKISTYNPIQTIDPQKLAVMTTNEIRREYGLEPIEGLNEIGSTKIQAF